MRPWVKYSSQVRKIVYSGEFCSRQQSQAGDAEDTGLEKWLSRRTLTTLPEAPVLYPTLTEWLTITCNSKPRGYNGPLLASTGTDLCAEKAPTHIKYTVLNRTDNPDDLKYSAVGSTEASMVETSQENKKKRRNLSETRRF